MTQIGLSARPQKDIRVKIGADNYEKHCSNVEFPEPKGKVKQWRGGTPDAIATALDTSEQVCNITMIQAWDDDESLCRFMFEHAGEKATISYKPHADNAFEVTAEITLVAPTIGGKTNEFNEATVSCPSTPPTPAA